MHKRFYLFALLLSICLINNAKAGLNTENDSTSTNSVEKKELKESSKASVSFEGAKFEKILLIATDNVNYKFTLSGRVQSRFDLSRSYDGAELGEWDRDIKFRRARLKSKGYVFNKKLSYKMELDLVNNQVLDAIIGYEFLPNTVIAAGQTKLPGNRERVISSQNLQFVDRSLLNSNFTLDRDLGVFLSHTFSAGKWIFREKFSVSTGEGKNFHYQGEHEMEDGYNYTGRVEALPFGKFAKKGDYVSSDLAREKTPKLSVGVTYSMNENAIREAGQRKAILSESRDTESIFADMMFKYNGWSVLGEYVHKSTDETPTIYRGDDIEAFITGQALNLQAGYLFRNNWEIAGRFTEVWQEDVTQRDDVAEYTLGLSKYVFGHNIKAQTDFSYRDYETKDDKFIWRMQVELSF